MYFYHGVSILSAAAMSSNCLHRVVVSGNWWLLSFLTWHLGVLPSLRRNLETIFREICRSAAARFLHLNSSCLARSSTNNNRALRIELHT